MEGRETLRWKVEHGGKEEEKQRSGGKEERENERRGKWEK